jgi:hypothetical protein
MLKILAAVTLTCAVAGCSGSGEANATTADGGRGTATTSVKREAAALTATLARSSVVKLTMTDSLSSRVDQPDQKVHAVVTADAKDEAGRVVIPAGSAATLRIVKLEPGSDQVRPEGRLELQMVSINIHGAETPVYATVGDIPHHMKGRGVTKDEAGRVAAGTAVGAGVGQLIGKDTRSTLIGAAIGTVAGGAVAVKYAYRDVIVDKGAEFTVALRAPLTVTLH